MSDGTPEERRIRIRMGQVHAQIADHCAEIAKLFRDDAKVTVLVRNPAYGKDHSADIFVSDDTPDEAIAAILALKDKNERKLTLEDLL